jgi:FlaA1/EpsC-like NDP-sugar epimerase
VKLVIKASKAKGGQVMIMDMGEQEYITDVAERLFGSDYPVNVIGAKEGEKLEEELMTEAENKNKIKKGKFFIV